MKKGLFRKGFVLGIICLFAGAGVISSTGTIMEKTSSAVIGSPGYIQDLIDNASDGDTIYIPSGTYYENIVINKSISLVGANRETTIIDGSGDNFVVIIYADRVTVSGFTIRNAREGIFLDNSFSNNNITGNTISNNKYGIYLDSLNSNNNIEDNIISLNTECGIYIDYSKFNIIKGNVISDSNHGIYLSESKYNIISGNNISNNYYGMYIHSSYRILDFSFNQIFKNNFLQNKRDAFFRNSILNRWRQNYWNEPRVLPKLIFGELYWVTGGIFNPKEHLIPWRPQIDWHPAKEPYDI